MRKIEGCFWKRIHLILVIVSAVLLMSAGTAIAKTVYVDQSNSSGTEDGTTPETAFLTIQEGVNAANQLDTVKVAPGLYNEDVSIDGVAIKLISADPSTTTVQGGGDVLNIFGAFSPASGFGDVEVAGFTITGGNNSGILLNSDTVKGIIHNNIILGNKYGIRAQNGADATIYNNTVLNNSSIGISANGAEVSASNNIIVDNEGCGLDAHRATINSAYDNLLSNTAGDYCPDSYNYGYINKTNDTSAPPLFLSGNGFHLSSVSPCIDAGSPATAHNDPDGTRNDQGVFGGPGSANFWPQPAGAPVVTHLSVTPSSVAEGGTLTLKATGKIP